MSAGLIRVAIVDDHEIFTHALSLFLEGKAGIHVVGAAHDGPTGVDLAVFERADVVLMDLNMPTMGGLEATKRLLAIKPDTRVIAISGHAADEARDAVLDAGAVDYLAKGQLDEVVVAAIERAIGRGAD